MTRFASLLRGINVSGRRKVSMAGLRALYAEIGLRDVVTYRQSGNVVFSSAIGSPQELAVAIEDGLRAALGYDDVDVLVRRAEELSAVAAGNPFLAEGADPSALYVTFLKSAPPNEGAGQSRGAVGQDAFVFGERAVYVHCPGGYGRTRLNNGFFERLTSVRATTRNWTTVTQLRDLTGRPR